MPRPGVDVHIVDDTNPAGANLDTGQAFFAGISERGPVDGPLQVTSLADYETKYGPRAGGSLLYDSVAAYFMQGGRVLHVLRLSGDAADTATAAFGALTADASSPGAWANDLDLGAIAPSTPGEIIAAGGNAAARVLAVILDGVIVERSPVVLTDAEAIAWTERSAYVRLSGAGALPALDTVASLAGGVDDGAITVDGLAAALDLFPYELGPGQVAIPGYASQGAYEALCAHAEKTDRCPVFDLPDSADPTVLAAALSPLQGTVPGGGEPGVRMSAAFGPYAVYPGQHAGTNVEVPYSAVQCALCAVADRGGNPNEPAAGINGVATIALGLTQSYTDEVREALNDLGCNLAKLVYGQVRTYGYRTAAGPADPTWRWWGNSRVIMAIAHEATAIGEKYVLGQIDGRRGALASFETELRGMLLRRYNAGALYGSTPEEAFTVDLGPTVNTIETIAAGEIHAVIRARFSPSGEWVEIAVVKVPVDRELVAA